PSVLTTIAAGQQHCENVRIYASSWLQWKTRFPRMQPSSDLDWLFQTAVVGRLPSMSRTTFFYQECPVCGRSLRVAVRYFGREMSCGHCHGEFVAGGTNSLPTPHVGA